MAFFGPDPLVLAHRGGRALGPENTLAAFDLGMAAGADGLELDVHLSADGVAVVHHDATLDRTTDGHGPVAARTAAELARLDAGAKWVATDGGFPFRRQGIGVPTLREVLQRFSDAPIVVELKENTAAIADAVAGELRAAGAVERVCVGGFGTRSLQAMRRALPEVMTSASKLEVRTALYRSWIGWPVRHPGFRAYQVPETAEGVRVVSPRFIRHAHRAGLSVQVWTVNDDADMDRLLVWGDDALITDRPDAAVAVRDAFVSRTMAKSDRV